LISNFRHVLNVVFLLGESPASAFYGTQNSDIGESPKRKNTISFFVYRDRQVMNTPTNYIGKYCSSVTNYKIFWWVKLLCC